MNRKTSSIPGLFLLLVYGLFACLSLVLVLLASQVYERIVDENQAIHSLRTAYSYLQNKFRNAYEELEIDQETLVFTYPLYETRIYYRDGTLYEENRLKESSTPVPAEPIAVLDGFEIDEDQNQIVLYTQGQQSTLHLYP